MAKIVLITGASTGIGRAAAELFAQKGWLVIATMRNPEKRDLKKMDNVEYLHLDVTDEKSIQNCITSIKEKHGKIDLLVNNAGYAVVGIFESCSSEMIHRQFDTNLFGLMNVTRAVLPLMRKQKGGTIINVASIGGRMGTPLYSLYQGTKWAVEGFSESLAYELEPLNIKVRIIEPGIIITDFYTRSMAVAENPPGLNGDYDEFTRKAVHNNEAMSKNGSTPELVARVIYKAAVTKSRRLRFHAGRDAGLILFLRNLLPLEMFRGVVRRMMLK